MKRIEYKTCNLATAREDEIAARRDSASSDIFNTHDKIRAFMRKLVLWKNNTEQRKFDFFPALDTFINENQLQPSSNLIKAISDHLNSLKCDFEHYFLQEMTNLEKMNWVINPFQTACPKTGLSTNADEELIDLSEDTYLKSTINRQRLTQFWLSLRATHPHIYAEAVKVLLPFTTSYLCEVGFSAMTSIKTKYRNKLDLSNSLRLKISRIKVDVEAVILKNRKQAHPSH